MAMDYEPYYSSGTDDDLPPSHQNRIPRGGRVTGNGRPAVMGSAQYPRMYGEADMEAQIHLLEQEAYSSVLRAFKAQADAITWEKEGIISDFKKLLRLSNEEHKDLLAKVNEDDIICRIREWRQSGGIRPGIHSTTQAVHEPSPSPSVSASRTDDDLPPSHQNRIPRGGRVAGNGRPAVMGSARYPRMYGETDMEAQIHLLEQEAYSSVLRAFKAQADAITLKKECIITELKKELRLSNEEHRDLLGKVNKDDVIRRIREWRQSGGIQPGIHRTTQGVREPSPNPSVSASRKKQKMIPSAA